MIRCVSLHRPSRLTSRLGAFLGSDGLSFSGAKIMSMDDESLLDAYLDGELEPEQRRAVESSLATDPQLAETALGLAHVRELVANLSRPASTDVAPEVMRRVRQVSLRRRPWTIGRRGGRWAVVGLAASAMAAIVLVPNFYPRRHGTVDDRLSAGTAYPSSPSGVNSPRPDPKPEVVAGASYPDSLPVNVIGPVGSAGVLSTPKAGQTPQTDQERVRKLLDDPRLRRVFLVADHMGQPVEQQVASLVERTTHRDYFKITVSQGIVVDPRHPGKATVFAVVLDENELGPFRDRLKKSFSDRLQEDDVSPAVAMQLTDIGQVVSFPPDPVGDLATRREDLALRVPAPGEPKDQQPALVAAVAEVNEPTAEQERSSWAAVDHSKASQQMKASQQKAGGAGANSKAPGDKLAGAVAHAPAADDDRPGHAGNSRGTRPAAAGAALRDGTVRGLPPSDKGHLVVLVWIAGTSSG